MGEMLDLGVKHGVIEKAGSWYSYDSERIGQGRENAKIYLVDRPEVAERIEAAIREAEGLAVHSVDRSNAKAVNLSA